MAAYLGVAIVVTSPGLLVAYLLRLPLGMLRTWAAIPLFSLASVFVLGEVAALTGVPFSEPALAALLFALSVAALINLVRNRGLTRNEQFDARCETPVARTAEEKIAHGLLGVGILAGAFIWGRGLQGVPLVLPGADGTRHGFMVGRILHTQSIDPSDILVLDPEGKRHVVRYFPLGGHALAALATRLAPTDAGEALVALTVVFAAVVLPLGMFVLARFLAPEWPLVAGFTALAVPALTLFPYTPAASGQVFAIVAMATVPVAFVLVTYALLTPDLPRGSPIRNVALHLPAALAVVGLVSVHSSELPLVAFLVLLLVLERSWIERRLRMLHNAAVRSLIVAGLALMLFAPTLGAFLGGVSERSSSTASGVSSDAKWTDLLGPFVTLRTYLPPEGFAALLHSLPSVRQYLLATLAFVGAAIWLWHRRSAWVVGWITVIVLSLFASTADNPFVRMLTFPWYGGSIRINWNQVFFVPFFAALPLALAVPAIIRVVRRRSGLVPAAIGVALVFTAFAGLAGYRTSWSFLRNAFSVRPVVFGNQARVDGSSEAAFRWLDAHTHRNETVINEPRVDGSLWMYTLDGVKPLLGLHPLDTSRNRSISRDWDDRRYVVQHIQDLGDDRRVDQLVRDYHARWIFVDDRNFPVAAHELKIDLLRRNPRISEVFNRGSVHVFGVDAGLRLQGH